MSEQEPLTSKIQKIISDPNALTMFRIAASPAVVIFMLWPTRFFSLIAAIIFSIAAITDYFDGYFARERGLVSNFGKIMDPVADKLLVSTALIMLASHGWVPAWIVCVIIAREIAVTGLRNIVVDKGEDAAASNLGKYKTGFQIAAIIPLLIHYSFLGLNAHAIGMFMIWGALIYTVWSGVDYYMQYKDLLKS